MKVFRSYFFNFGVTIQKNKDMRSLQHSLTIAMILFFSVQLSAQKKIDYPNTRKGNHIDEYHGVKVADPYRWLEDDRSEETAAWVLEQNAVTEAHMKEIPFRNDLKERLTKIWNYPKIGAPFREGEYYFFFKNSGIQNQSVLYYQKGLKSEPEVLIDPNKLSDDGTAALSNFSVSHDGKYAAYSVSRAGSDWKEFFVIELATKKKLDDRVEWVKFSGASWKGHGFYYSRYDAPKEGAELTNKNEFHKVYYHKVGTSQEQDQLIYQRSEERRVGQECRSRWSPYH